MKPLETPEAIARHAGFSHPLDLRDAARAVRTDRAAIADAIDAAIQAYVGGDAQRAFNDFAILRETLRGAT